MKIFTAVILSSIIGYGLGCLSPSALISKIKNKNLREHGTKNLGASNVTLTFGKKLGAAVMLFDILKAFFAYKISELLFPILPLAGIIAGVAAVVGHIFPFYMKFKGGKGLAAFGGLMLALNPLLFLFLIISGIILIIIVNQCFVMSYFAAIVTPIWVGFATKNFLATILVACASLLLMWKHFENLKKAVHHADVDVRDYIKNNILKIKSKK